MNNLWKERRWMAAGLILLVTFVTYMPALRAGFIWDDDLLITNNPMVRARDGLHGFWFTTESPDYIPLTSSFWWLQWRLWGKSAVGYHAVNVLLHAANVVLIWMVLRRLRIPGGWLAALLFAVHPVNVATVAWISEQKNTLSMLFFALSVLWYLRFDEENGWYWYGISLAAFLAALLSKAAVVTLPVVLLGCVWWMRGRLRSKDLLRTAPFFALSILLGLTAVWFQTHRVLNGRVVHVGLFSRLALAGLTPWFYLYKAVLPLNLCLIYPQWNPERWGWSGCLPGIVLAGSFALLWWKRNGWGRPLLFGLGYFVVMLFPVLGFFNMGYNLYSMVADHWQYYSIPGVTALAAAGAMSLGRRLHPGQQQDVGLAAGVVVIAFAVLSWQRCQVFQNPETLFRDTLLHNPLAWVAHDNLGSALETAGRTQEAIGHFEQALRIRPDVAETHYNLGLALEKAGRTQEAVDHYKQTLQISPDYPEAHVSLGNALLRAGKNQEAIGHFEQALRIRPDYPEAHISLGYALIEQGSVQEGIEHFENALRIRPDFPEAHNSLGNALLMVGKNQEAIEHYEQAIRIKPDYSEAQYDLGLALEGAGRTQEAIGHFEQVLRIRPDDAEAQYNLGLVLTRTGRFQEAIMHFQEALRVRPDYPEAHAALENVRFQANNPGNRNGP